MKKKFSGGKAATYVVLIFWMLTTIYPFFWVIQNSFKEKSAIRTQSFALPIGELFTLNNYAEAFKRMNIGRAYLNSLVISVCVTFIVLILGGFTAYGLSRYRFKGRNLLYSLVVGSMMFPVFAVIIPVFRMEYAMNIVNTDSYLLNWLSVILPQSAGNLTFAVIVLMGFFNGLGLDLEEAAYMEGCNIFQTFFTVVVPITRPCFATVAIFTFLWSYNDLFTQMFFLRYEEYRTITLLLNQISSKAGTNYGMMAAAVVLIVVPVLIVYLFLQKNIIKGLTAGAVKG